MSPRTRGKQGGRGTVAAALAFAALIALVLPGCSAAGDPGEVTSPTLPGSATSARQDEVPATQRSAPLPPAQPTSIEVPRIGARSSLIPLGLNPDQTIEVPPVEQPMQAGWYEHGPTPGEAGPAVILGHVNGKGEDGIFARLRELRPGDEIRVGREDGQIARFVVERMAQEPKTGFPAEEVYGNTAGPELRLITCGGEFDDAADSYRDNVIAFAVFIGVVNADA